MPSLIAYRKASDAYTTYQLLLPDRGQSGEPDAQEIATLDDGRTIVSLRDGVTLPPDQPPAIAASIQVLPSPLPPALRKRIRAASPHNREIKRRVVEKIREVYDLEDELEMLRVGTGEEVDAWRSHVQACRAWGREERAKLGI